MKFIPLDQDIAWGPLFYKKPIFFVEIKPTLIGEEFYKNQLDRLANALLLEDVDTTDVVKSTQINMHCKFPYFPKGSLLSGSFVMSVVSSNLTSGGNVHKYDDVDIYFHSKEDALIFAKLNELNFHFRTHNTMCTYGTHQGVKLNLIYGVKYNSAADLISKFDIRACSMAIDPNNNMLYYVDGAPYDATNNKIVFNSVPRSVTIRRLTKYIEKGFRITDSYQSLFFVELLKSNIYNAELELHTKQY